MLSIDSLNENDSLSPQSPSLHNGLLVFFFRGVYFVRHSLRVPNNFAALLSNDWMGINTLLVINLFIYSTFSPHVQLFFSVSFHFKISNEYLHN